MPCPALSRDEIAKRFIARTKRESDCWNWTSHLNEKGYGRAYFKGRNWYTHRISFELFVGPVAPDDVICHRCDNPRCVNPEHLFRGTRLDNNRDSKAKGRNARGERSARAKLTDADVLAIRAASAAGARQIDLAKQYGVHENMIYFIRARKNWQHI